MIVVKKKFTTQIENYILQELVPLFRRALFLNTQGKIYDFAYPERGACILGVRIFFMLLQLSVLVLHKYIFIKISIKIHFSGSGRVTPRI